jgi:hypothetical protein
MRRALVIVGCFLALVALAATQSQYFNGDVTVAGSLRDVNGTNYLKEAPLNSTIHGRSNGVWVAVPTGSGGGLSDAPSDGSPYGRLSGGWANLYAYFSELAHGHSISGVSGLSDALAARSLVGHTHPWSDISSPPDFSTNGHAHAASAITSGLIDPARIGTGTPTTATYLRGNGSGGLEFSTLPTTPSPTNGIPEAPDDATAYVRKGLAWVGLDIDDVAGVTGFGRSFLATTDEVDALSLLALVGSGGVATIDSPAKYAVRVNSSGTTSTRHRLNVIAGTGISTSISDDAGNDESDVTVSLGSHSHDWADITGEPAFVETSRTISTTNSLTGGGDLSANRTLSLVNDSASPGNSKYYGTDSGGTKGFHSLPSSSGDAPWAVASFNDPGSAGVPIDCPLVSGSSSGVHGVYREEDGLYRVDLLSAQPAGSFKRVAFAFIPTGYSSYSAIVISNATWRTTATNVFVYVSQGGSTSNFETNNPVMFRLYNH